MMRVVVLVIALLVAGCGSAAPTVTPEPLPVATLSATPALTSAPTSTAASTAASTPTSTPTSSPAAAPTTTTAPPGPLTVSSQAFPNDGEIPAAYTCHGSDMSPDIAWTGVPTGAAALVLLVTDRDAGGFAHWIVLDLAPSNAGLGRAAGVAVAPLHQGTNDFGRVGWGGPCPPSGTHHYRFTLYALAAPLALAGHPRLPQVSQALASATVLSSAHIEGWYKRP
jgi:Raf kinase inhibitor-like YbhB/YbcL family protein